MNETQKKHPFFVGFLFAMSFYSLSIYGKFYILEAILFLIFIHSLFMKINFDRISNSTAASIRGDRFYKTTVFYLVTLAFISIATGLLRGAEIADQLKGFALIFFTLTNYLGARALTKLNSSLIEPLFYGFAISGFLGFYFQPNEYARQEIWKFGFSYSVTYLIVLLLMKHNRFKRRTFQIILILFGLLAISLGTRSLGLCVVATGGALIYTCRNKRDNSSAIIRSDRYRVTLFAVVVLLVVMVTGYFYGVAAKSGVLGESSRNDYLIQSSGDYGPIVGGRAEPVIALLAVAKSPVFGYGYGADSAQEMYQSANVFFQKHNYRVNVTTIQRKNDGNIPQHSYLLNFWISYGIFGLLFWIFILRNLIYITIRELKIQSFLLPLLLYVTILMIWNIFFSPYGAGVRIEFSLILVMVETLYRRHKIEEVL